MQVQILLYGFMTIDQITKDYTTSNAVPNWELTDTEYESFMDRCEEEYNKSSTFKFNVATLTPHHKRC